MAQSRGVLPSFKYHPDPVGTGAFEKQSITCEICEQTSEFAYVGPFYAVEEVDDICPWCIKDGSAANKFDGEFQDSESCEEVKSDSYVDELVHRTPGYLAWQLEEWLSHCGDFCAYVGSKNGYWIKEHYNDIKASDDKLMKAVRTYLGDDGFIDRVVDSEDSFRLYVFQCLSCGEYRLRSDSD